VPTQQRLLLAEILVERESTFRAKTYRGNLSGPGAWFTPSPRRQAPRRTAWVCRSGL